MNAAPANPARRPNDPLLRAADAALRRAAIKAQERAKQVRQSSQPTAPERKATQ